VIRLDTAEPEYSCQQDAHNRSGLHNRFAADRVVREEQESDGAGTTTLKRLRALSAGELSAPSEAKLLPPWKQVVLSSFSWLKPGR